MVYSSIKIKKIYKHKNNELVFKKVFNTYPNPSEAQIKEIV